MPQIRGIFNEVIASSNAVYSEEPTTLENRIEWFDAKMASGFPLLVAADGPEVFGYASYGPFRPAQGYRFTVEHTIHVRSDKRGLGIATELLERIMIIAQEQGMHAMIGAIDSANLKSISMHEKHGFVEVARLREIANKHGIWLTLVLMQKILGQE